MCIGFLVVLLVVFLVIFFTGFFFFACSFWILSSLAINSVESMLESERVSSDEDDDDDGWGVGRTTLMGLVSGGSRNFRWWGLKKYYN
jgi:hypothetical protein